MLPDLYGIWLSYITVIQRFVLTVQISLVQHPKYLLCAQHGTRFFAINYLKTVLQISIAEGSGLVHFGV